MMIFEPSTDVQQEREEDDQKDENLGNRDFVGFYQIIQGP